LRSAVPATQWLERQRGRGLSEDHAVAPRESACDAAARAVLYPRRRAQQRRRLVARDGWYRPGEVPERDRRGGAVPAERARLLRAPGAGCRGSERLDGELRLPRPA